MIGLYEPGNDKDFDSVIADYSRHNRIVKLSFDPIINNSPFVILDLSNLTLTTTNFMNNHFISNCPYLRFLNLSNLTLLSCCDFLIYNCPNLEYIKLSNLNIKFEFRCYSWYMFQHAEELNGQVIIDMIEDKYNMMEYIKKSISYDKNNDCNYKAFTIRAKHSKLEGNKPIRYQKTIIKYDNKNGHFILPRVYTYKTISNELWFEDVTVVREQTRDELLAEVERLRRRIEELETANEY